MKLPLQLPNVHKGENISASKVSPSVIWENNFFGVSINFCTNRSYIIVQPDMYIHSFFL